VDSASSFRGVGRPFDRLCSDLQARYPNAGDTDLARRDHDAEERLEETETQRKLKKLPPEIGVLLIAVGVAGVLLPGPVGTPFVIAGGVVLWPGVFGKVENWFQRRYPNSHRSGMDVIDRYMADLEKRFPGTIESLD
jgi:hypothetical protein